MKKEIEIPSEEVVPGDVVFLESGMKVPADIRLMDAMSLEIDESFLTGESVAAIKHVGIIGEDHAVGGERSNMAFGGSTVMKREEAGVWWSAPV
ncbi:MAG: hypothetical protein MZV64_24535 [Ignavibacteriales bacterium]|nr:hypothetical protein [Ignavibacteriales bacterium]